MVLFGAGGADNLYKFVNSTDMRSAKIPGGVKYMLQGVHTTSTTYNDSLSMAVTSNNSKVTIVKVTVIPSV